MVLLIWPMFAQAQGRRVALVVGASAYLQVPKLSNPVNDALAISAALRRLGFDVQQVVDPDRAEFERAIRGFGQAARNAEVALFYYSGHGFQVNGRNWLVPVSAKLESPRDLRFEAIDLDLITEQTDGAARATLIFLDACRDNPFERKWTAGSRGNEPRGLARIEAASGGLIVYSTAPGRVALDGTGQTSPFTTALLSHIETPQLEVRQMLTRVRRDVQAATKGAQVPYDTSSLEGDFFFKPVNEPPPAPLSAPTMTMPPPQDSSMNLEALFWQSIKDNRSPEEYRAYLKRYPNGIFADLAKSRLQAAGEERGRKGSEAPAKSGVPTVSGLTQPLGLPAPASPAASLKLLTTPLGEALAKHFPTSSEKFRIERVDNYNKVKDHKALAIAPPDRTWTTSGWETKSLAETAALERCQVRYRTSCGLLASDNAVIGALEVRDMPRVRWRGVVDPDRVPLLGPSAPTTEAWLTYIRDRSFKAIAYHPSGKLVMQRSGVSQQDAEDQALKECNEDPQRNGRDGPCFLYAVRNSVVLPYYFSAARKPAATVEEVLSLIQAPIEYKSVKDNKALAYAINRRGSFRAGPFVELKNAADAALEGCQLTYNEDCVLVAQNDKLIEGDPFAAMPRRASRLDYIGKVSRDRLPVLFRGKTAEIAAYEALRGPRAMAVRPSGSIVSVAGGATQRAAEQQALDACNKDQSSYACFLYAAQDQVVISQRRTEPR